MFLVYPLNAVSPQYTRIQLKLLLFKACVNCWVRSAMELRIYRNLYIYCFRNNRSRGASYTTVAGTVLYVAWWMWSLFPFQRKGYNIFSSWYILHIPEQKQMEPGCLVLRHSIPIKTLPSPTFHQVLKALRIEWRNWETLFTSLPKLGKIMLTETLTLNMQIYFL